MTAIPAVTDKQKMHVAIISRIERRAKIAFHLVGRIPDRQSQPVRDAKNMGIDRDRGNVERDGQHDVSGLSPDAGKRYQLVHRTRHVAAEFFDEHFATTLDIRSFVLIQSATANTVLEFFERHGAKRFGRVRDAEQFFGNRIDTLVRALRAQNNGNEQFEIAAVNKLASRLDRKSVV